jgi:hypothetical protein
VKKLQNYLIDCQGPFFGFYKKTGALIICIYKDPKYRKPSPAPASVDTILSFLPLPVAKAPGFAEL